MSIDLHRGDAFVLLNNMANKSVDITFTSPPFNRKRNDKYANYNDVIDDYFGWVENLIDECVKKTKRHVIVNLQTNYYNRTDVYKIIGRFAEKIQNIIVWEKSNPLPANGNNLTNAYELFLVIGDNPIKSNTTYTKNHITTSVNSQSTTKIHKAVMKQEVADWFIEKFTNAQDIVFDPLMGLGTTGISCKKYGRNFIGCEIDEQYYKIAQERICGHSAFEDKAEREVKECHAT